jgi:ankyrin repeat protein
VLYLMVGLALALFALRSLTAIAHETDQYTLPVGREFADLGPHLSRVVHGAIVEAVNGTNAAIRRSLRDTGPTGETERLQSAEVISGEVWLQLFAAFPINESLDAGLASQRMHALYPGLITAYRPEQSIYEDPVLMLDVTKVVRTFARACTVNADGNLIGTDKIIHFLNLGHIYHSAYLSARKRGLRESQAVSEAVQLSAGNNLFLSENALLGLLTTGIRSNADLAANYAGFKFYRNLTEEVRIGNRVMAPMLVRDGPYWRLNDQVRPDSDFFTAFITPHWNEALNPNTYAIVTDARVRAMLRRRCPDLLDWYRDERGRRLSREQFIAVEKRLSTWYGEPYGYQNDGESRVSIATTCFRADRPIGADQRAPALLGPNVDEFGRTRLWWAARHGRLEEVERLLAEGEGPNQMDIDGEGPLHAAARWGHVDVVEVLLLQGADIDAKAAYGMTPLEVAVERAQLHTTRALLQHSADPNARNVFGRSPLHDAVAHGNGQLVALLLQHGGDAGATDDNGTTPLHLAARGGNARVVGALLAHGANPSARNLAGATAYDLAKQQDHLAILQQLTNANPGKPGHAIAEARGHAEESDRY